MRTVDERRSGIDRRQRRVSLRFPERRSGFDQRHPVASTLRARYRRAIRDYREKRTAFLLVLATLIVFNYIDLLLTVRALEAGASEANPIMAWLFERSVEMAAVVKLAIGAVCVLLLLALGRFRRALEASLVMLALYTVLMVYHVVIAIRLA